MQHVLTYTHMVLLYIFVLVVLFFVLVLVIPVPEMYLPVSVILFGARKFTLIDGLVQDCCNSSALAMELLQSCNKPLNCLWI